MKRLVSDKRKRWGLWSASVHLTQTKTAAASPFQSEVASENTGMVQQNHLIW